ncbi:MAG: presqualene diphosphate synthase HpnD [Alphaproteobacteria bacterium]
MMATAHPIADSPAPSPPDVEAIREQVRAAGSSFYWAMRVLPPVKRDAIFAVYAFARDVDDIADGDWPDDRKRQALAEWRTEIEALYTGVPNHRITRALVQPIKTFDLQKSDFLALIDGMEMDGLGPIRAPSMDDLILYCDRVACAVGRLCVRIFGEPGPAGQRTANHLGLALQLTNILRDVVEDSEMGRLYLPAELLQAAGITETDPVKVATDPSLSEVCWTLSNRAAEEFVLAEAAISECSRRTMRPAIMMMMVYRKTLERLRAKRFADMTDTDVVSKPEKLWIALRYGLV